MPYGDGTGPVGRCGHGRRGMCWKSTDLNKDERRKILEEKKADIEKRLSEL